MLAANLLDAGYCAGAVFSPHLAEGLDLSFEGLEAGGESVIRRPQASRDLIYEVDALINGPVAVAPAAPFVSGGEVVAPL